jgi:cyclopropane fatty-acyl-phospholipid synthase-like methyltransferase
MLYLLKKIIKACLPYGIVVMLARRHSEFPGSRKYWENRYAKGGNSGAGSYNRLAEFKSDTINEFVKSNNIQTVIEFGCGDGNQLSLASYPQYTGFDVSKTAIKLCKSRFKYDNTKMFCMANQYNGQKAELVLSLDVIYHLIEDTIYEKYIKRLFSASTKFVIIYACDFDGDNKYHVKPRNFTRYIKEKISGWNMLKHIPNKYPMNENDPENTSWSDFYIYTKI